MTTFKKDGTLSSGSVDITILEIPGEIYTANNFNWNQDAASDVSKNHADGSPKGFEVKPGWTNGTVDLQLADDDQEQPQINHTFVIGDAGYALIGRGLAKEQNGEWKFTAAIRKLANPLITVPYAAATYSIAAGAITPIDSAAVGPEAGLTYAWTASGLPSGLAINASTGEITGTPDTVETTTLKVYAASTNADGNAIKGYREIPITITA